MGSLSYALLHQCTGGSTRRHGRHAGATYGCCDGIPYACKAAGLGSGLRCRKRKRIGCCSCHCCQLLQVDSVQCIAQTALQAATSAAAANSRSVCQRLGYTDSEGCVATSLRCRAEGAVPHAGPCFVAASSIVGHNYGTAGGQLCRSLIRMQRRPT